MEKKKVTIVTHNSKFHTDDIFAVATLLLVLEKDYKVTVVRSRDPEVFSVADYVADIGFVYDPEKNRFDHHQEGGAGVRENGVPYASFGLVWKKFGEQLCGNVEVAQRVEKKLVQPTDATDNGVQTFEPTLPDVYPYTLDTMRRAFMPTWKEGAEHLDGIFMELVGFAKKLLMREITKAQHDKEAGDAVKRIYTESQDKRLIVLDQYYPAHEYLAAHPEPLFTVFPSSDDGTWLLKTIQDNPINGLNRKDLPKSWAGKRGDTFEKVSGVPGAIFCHNNLFLAVAQTKGAILKLAEIALNS